MFYQEKSMKTVLESIEVHENQPDTSTFNRIHDTFGRSSSNSMVPS